MTGTDEKLKRVSQKPGVYLFKDEHGIILYVGKARQLRNRLRSHFKPGKNEDLRHKKLMEKVADFDYIITDEETEALILENNLIKEHKPRYNVNLKDDKTYPFIRLTAEPYPRIFLTRKRICDGSRYFGPYTDVHAIRQLVNAVHRIFLLRTCTLNITEESIQRQKHKVCLNFHIGRCKGPCEGKIPREEYLKMIDQTMRFIEGKNSALIKELNARMMSLAEQQRFEDAALLRNQIRGIEAFRKKQKVVDQNASNRDILAMARQDGNTCIMVFDVRDGKMINQRHFYIHHADVLDDPDILSSFIKQYYSRSEYVPPEILIPFGFEDIESVQIWLVKKRQKKTEFVIPARGKKAQILKMCLKNARLLLDELKAQQQALSARVAEPVKALQKDLGLKHPPVHIEAFDISNTQGTDAVASMVVFENGKPKKSAYRKYKIKTVSGPDDFQSMAEVVERRLSRIVSESLPMPDLILVDGGKGQLSSAIRILEKYESGNTAIAGLAKKNEEVFLPGYSDAQTIAKHSPGLQLLQRIRDEAHRFAITFHRQLRQKRIISSELDAIPGIGPARRTELLKAFGSVAVIRQADIEALAAVKGMNDKSAEAVFSHFHDN